jgi:monothiol glutaredoxin
VPVPEEADRKRITSPCWLPIRLSNAGHVLLIRTAIPPIHPEIETMPSRPHLDEKSVAPAALSAMESFHAKIVRDVQESVRLDRIVVVGMAQNAYVANVRKLLDEAGVTYTYLEYGSYFSKWKERLAIKLWSGWPTFPQVFVNGTLIGGEELTKAALADGSLKSSVGRAAAVVSA